MSNFAKVRRELQELLPQAASARIVSIAVLIPCHNEAATIVEVVEGFRAALPNATVYVYDNNSTDRTAELAAAAGAVVRRERRQGKGYVVRKMFADIDADVYVLTDGDLTYDASAAGQLVDALVADNLDMVVGVRVGGDGAYRPGHAFGNRMFNLMVAGLFGDGFTDILSGYRALSRRFVKAFPGASTGFEIETELSIHALDLQLGTAELGLPYGVRPQDSQSKLRTFRDGARILTAIVLIYKRLKPLQFLGGIGLFLVAIGFVLGAPVIFTFLRTGFVPRLPTAVLAAALCQIGFMALGCGVILDGISQTRREMKRMRYLELGPASAESQSRRVNNPPQ
jgi:glycosyltransferase involved in cell wall biosynthesis